MQDCTFYTGTPCGQEGKEKCLSQYVEFIPKLLEFPQHYMFFFMGYENTTPTYPLFKTEDIRIEVVASAFYRGRQSEEFDINDRDAAYRWFYNTVIYPGILSETDNENNMITRLNLPPSAELNYKNIAQAMQAESNYFPLGHRALQIVNQNKKKKYVIVMALAQHAVVFAKMLALRNIQYVAIGSSYRDGEFEEFDGKTYGRVISTIRPPSCTETATDKQICEANEGRSDKDLLSQFVAATNTDCNILLFDSLNPAGLNMTGIDNMLYLWTPRTTNEFLQTIGRINRLCDTTNTNKTNKVSLRNTIHILTTHDGKFYWDTIQSKVESLYTFYDSLFHQSFDYAVMSSTEKKNITMQKPIWHKQSLPP